MKTLIFDFDGTIADSFATFVGIFEEITGRSEKLTLGEIDKLRGQHLGQILRYLKVRKWQIPRLAIKARKAVALKILDIHPFNGLPEEITKLHKKGYVMFILSTNSSENITKFLKANNLDSYFTRIYGDIGIRSKSSALKKLMGAERLTPKQCVYIGDEVRDAEAAHKVGVAFLAVGWGFNHPEALKKANPTGLAATPSKLSEKIIKL